jgi:hypothetical protein
MKLSRSEADWVREADGLRDLPVLHARRDLGYKDIAAFEVRVALQHVSELPRLDVPQKSRPLDGGHRHK